MVSKKLNKHLDKIYHKIGYPGGNGGITKLWRAIRKKGNPLKLTRNAVEDWLYTQPTYALASKQLNEYFEKIYYDIGNPGGYGGITKLFRAVEEQGNPHNLTRQNVEDWLFTQPTYAKYAPYKKVFPRQKILMNTMDEQWDADLMHMTAPNLKKKNKSFAYLAVFIDLFSRHLWVEPMKTKNAVEMLKVMKKVFRHRKPSILRTDDGGEYTANKVQAYLKSKGIHHIYAKNPMHANYAERVILTLKRLLYKMFSKRQSYKYIDKLQDLVRGYNNTTHSSIGMKPGDVTPENEQELYERVVLPQQIKEETTPVHFQYRVGDHVRLTYLRGTFHRGYQENWTEQVFTIARRYKTHPPRYKLRFANGELVPQSYYEPELQEAYVDENTVYLIEKVLQRKTVKGEKWVKVRWQGYDKSHDSWVLKSTIVAPP